MPAAWMAASMRSESITGDPSCCDRAALAYKVRLSWCEVAKWRLAAMAGAVYTQKMHFPWGPWAQRVVDIRMPSQYASTVMLPSRGDAYAGIVLFSVLHRLP